MTREDIEGRDQEGDDAFEIMAYTNQPRAAGEAQAEKTAERNVRSSLSAIVRPTAFASPEQWRPKRRASAAGRNNSD